MKTDLLFQPAFGQAFHRRLEVSRCGVTLALNLGICIVAGLAFIFIGKLEPQILIFLGAALCLLSLVHQLIVGANLILLYRLFLIGSFGLLAVPQLVLFPNISLSPTMIEFQTLDNGAVVALMSALAMGATGIAWVLVMSGYRNIPRSTLFVPPKIPLQRLFIVFGTLFCLIQSSTSSAVLFGSFNYGNSSNSGTQFLDINTWGIAGLACYLNIFILELRNPRRLTMRRFGIIIFIISILFYCFVLRGFRSEFVTFTATATMLHWQFRNRGVLTWRYVASLSAIVFLLGAFTLLLGAVRSAEDAGTAKRLALQSLMPTTKSHDVTTGVDVAALDWLPNIGSAPLVMCVVGLHQENAYNYMLGITLLDRLRNTLPRSINPFRTDDLAMIYDSRFNVTSTGGMPELAEAYLNFGPCGAIILPGFISFFIFLFYRRALERDNFQSWALFGSILMSIVYSNLYGIGHVYKAGLTGVLINISVFSIYNIFMAKDSYADADQRRFFRSNR
jgi:hypothetical protein